MSSEAGSPPPSPSTPSTTPSRRGRRSAAAGSEQPSTPATPAASTAAPPDGAAQPGPEAAAAQSKAEPSQGKAEPPGVAPAASAAPAAPVSDDAGQEAFNIAGLNFTQAQDVHVTDLHFLMLIYGDSGAGKTHFACQAEDVVVVLAEPQGFATIHDANPKATIVGSPDEIVGHPRCKNFQEIRTFFEAAAKGKLPKWVKTIVIDSLTEVQQLMIDEIVKKKRQALPQVAAKPGEEKPKGPAPEMTKQDWGTLSVNFRNFMRTLRGLPYNIICLALPEQDVDEETGKRTIVPKLSGGMKTAIPAYFNIVGYIYKQMTPNGMQRAVMLDSDSRYLTKGYGGLVGVVEPDVRKWFRVLAQEEESGSAASSLRPPGTVAPSRRGINSAAPAPAPAAAAASGQEDSEY